MIQKNNKPTTSHTGCNNNSGVDPKNVIRTKPRVLPIVDPERVEKFHPQGSTWTWVWICIIVSIIVFGGLSIKAQSPDSVLAYCQEIGIHHPEIVTAQSILETGHYKCEGCSLDSHNLFGFRWKGKYLSFDSWRESCDYYLKWQTKHFDPTRDYYDFLNCMWLHRDGRCQPYAESLDYIDKLKTIEL